MTEYPILGFAPALSPDTRGILTTSSAVLPTSRGIGSGITGTLLSTSTSENPCGSFIATTISGTQRVYFGTQTKLYEYVSSANTDRSATTYHATTSARWSFAQYGDKTLAVNIGDAIQSSSGAAFAAIAGAPKASIIIVAGPPNFQSAMVFDYDNGTHYSDGIFWSAGSNETDWTPSVATGCGNVRLTDNNGKFTAALPYRDGVIAWKQRAMYVGAYVGAPDLWDWKLISSSVGCAGKNACVSVNDQIYFVDEQGVWIFDGSYPRPCPGFVHQWLASNMYGAPDERIKLTWDKRYHQLWVRYNDNSFGSGSHLVYNPQSQIWTNYGSIALTGSAIEGIVSENYLMAGLNAQLALISRTATASSFRLGAHGKYYGTTTITGIRPKWVLGPTDTATGWLTGTLYYGGSLHNVTGNNDTMTFRAPGELQVVRTSRFLSPQVEVTAGTNWECAGIAVAESFTPDGE